MRRVVAAAILLGCAALVPHKCTRQRLQPARAERSHCCNALGVSALAEPLLRRAAGVSALALALIMPSTAQAAECKTKPGALYAVRTGARYGVQGDGRLAGCLPSENCVSSSAIKSPAQFDAPWLFSPATRDADRAFEDSVKAAKASPDLKIAETDPARRYLRATAPSQISNYKATDVDDLEVLISAEKGLVFHRSVGVSVFSSSPRTHSVPLGDSWLEPRPPRGAAQNAGLGEYKPAARGFQVDSPGSYQALKFGM